MITEFHLFAGIGGGIYGGALLGHKCVGAVEIDGFCEKILRLRQQDGWMEKFSIYGDLTKLDGNQFRGTFDVLCGGFPCQAFSHAAHGMNISAKNLWGEMLRFTQESNAPIVFAENVTFKALDKARIDLQQLGYIVEVCKLSCKSIGADHRRDRFWLLAVKDYAVFSKVTKQLTSLPKLNGDCWNVNPNTISYPEGEYNYKKQLKAIGNAQSPYAAATAFRVLVNRHLNGYNRECIIPNKSEIENVFEIVPTWIRMTYGNDFGLVHTPTTMANYCCPSMMKHQGCRNYKQVFGKPTPKDAEYLMGFPIGASFPGVIDKDIPKPWVLK